jgi:hypothetical protein
MACGSSDPLHPIDPPSTTAVVPPFVTPPALPPDDAPPNETPPAAPPASPPQQPYCAAEHSACTDNAGRAGECIGGACIAWDMQTYGNPPEPGPTWCPLSGVGLPAEQRLNPQPGAACSIIGGGEQAYGICPSDPANIQSFADTDLSTLSQRVFDLRWLKFAGVESLRFVAPLQPSRLDFMITDFAWGGGLVDYKVSITDTPCAVGAVETQYDMHHCETPGREMLATIGYSDPGYPTPCTGLLPGHAYYLNIAGSGPADPGGDGVIDAGDRMLITVAFYRP